MKKCPLGHELCREWDDDQAILLCAKAYSNQVERCIGMALAMERMYQTETLPPVSEDEPSAEVADHVVTATVTRLRQTVAFQWGARDDAKELRAPRQIRSPEPVRSVLLPDPQQVGDPLEVGERL
ncbi:MAG: hypothetical protein NZT92_18800 [Abditibacteriales bacterium]|nr:hypothetical protein [Abditibacteriales bacterium]MDW8367802.1 hypothetical protein [Abditibacteriales bacterium]